jgi:transaldolase
LPAWFSQKGVKGAGIMSNPLQKLQECGQSVWYDNVDRDLLQSGRFQELIDDYAVVGCTTNPTIFMKAVKGGNAYDAQIKQSVAAGKSLEEIYTEIMVNDISTVADILRPVYDSTKGQDGFVSIEVSPLLAADTAQSIEVARHFNSIFNHPNVMVKIPATPEGIPAIEECISEGININITMIFALEAYEKVADAYLTGLERLAASQKKPLEKPLSEVASVASFFVSRVDTLVDRLLQEKINQENRPEEKKALEGLLGKAAIANSRLVYERFEQIFSSPRFKKLEKQGARVQRVLWASTSTKNPRYRDVLYAEQLIGPHTIDTMPQQTIEAFADHGQVALTVNQGYDEARKVFEQLEAAGIDMKQVTAQLLHEGISGFVDSFYQMIEEVEKKR